MSHAKVMLNLSITDHKAFYTYIFVQFMLHKINQSKHMTNIQKHRNKQNKHASHPASCSDKKVSLKQAPFA